LPTDKTYENIKSDNIKKFMKDNTNKYSQNDNHNNFKDDTFISG